MKRFMLILFFPQAICLHAQYDCGIRQLAFKAGEHLEYKVVYNWGVVWLESGHSSFSVAQAENRGKAAFHFKGRGGTYPRYDWFYKVDDVFESVVDSASFRPIKFTATVNEGNKHDKHTYLFNNSRRQIYTVITRGRKTPAVDTVPATNCTIDVLSAIYYARSLDYSGMKVKDTIGMSLVIDGKIYPIYVRYLGRDVYTSSELGSFKCIKFSPLLVEGSIFKAGEGMTVWVSDDENKLPLFIETPIIVGTVKVSLVRFSGLRFPLQARTSEPPTNVKKGKKP